MAIDLGSTCSDWDSCDACRDRRNDAAFEDYLDMSIDPTATTTKVECERCGSTGKVPRRRPVRDTSAGAPCPKCCGQGTIDAYWYYQAGVCFRCGGGGRIPA